MPLWERYSAGAAPSTHPPQFCRNGKGSVTACPQEREQIWTDVYTNQMCYVPPSDPDMAECHDALWDEYLKELE